MIHQYSRPKIAHYSAEKFFCYHFEVRLRLYRVPVSLSLSHNFTQRSTNAIIIEYELEYEQLKKNAHQSSLVIGDYLFKNCHTQHIYWLSFNNKLQCLNNRLKFAQSTLYVLNYQ